MPSLGAPLLGLNGTFPANLLVVEGFGEEGRHSTVSFRLPAVPQASRQVSAGDGGGRRRSLVSFSFLLLSCYGGFHRQLLLPV